MGEYADIAVGDAVEGWLSDGDEWCGWLGPRIRRQNKACKYCRKSNLVWRNHQGGWRLFETIDNKLQIHSCKEWEESS